MSSKAERLIKEYRPTMDREVLHSWAADAVAELRALSTPPDPVAYRRMVTIEPNQCDEAWSLFHNNHDDVQFYRNTGRYRVQPLFAGPDLEPTNVR